MTALGGLFANRGTHQGRAFKAYQNRRARDTLNHFADRLAEHGDVRQAAAEIGRSEQYGYTLLKRLRDKLGWQAQ